MRSRAVGSAGWVTSSTILEQPKKALCFNNKSIILQRTVRHLSDLNVPHLIIITSYGFRALFRHHIP